MTLPAFVVMGLGSASFLAYFSTEAWLYAAVFQSTLLYPAWVGHWFFQKKFGWRRATLAFPLLCTVTDWLQNLMPHSLQTNALAHVQGNMPWLIQYVEWTGVWGATFWVALCNVLIARAVDEWQHHRGNLSEGWWGSPTAAFFAKKLGWKMALLFGLPLLHAAWVFNSPTPASPPGGATHARVSLLQTNTDSYATADSALLSSILIELLTLADSAVCSGQPDLLVMPESAVPVPLFQDSLLLSYLRRGILKWETSVALGFSEPADPADSIVFFNTSYIFTPALAAHWDSLGVRRSDLAAYSKRKPMPFTEFVPYADWLGLEGKIQPLSGRTVQAGENLVVFGFPDSTGREMKTAAAICWEQMFPAEMAEMAERGAQFFTQMNNDGWFYDSPGSVILLNINRFRAIENRRSIARCSNSGISTFIDPFGNLYGTLPRLQAAVGTEAVALRNDLTFFTRWKNWFAKACLLALGLMVLGAMHGTNKRKSV
jgi:apolipoprotein N-acyltransferase